MTLPRFELQLQPCFSTVLPCDSVALLSEFSSPARGMCIILEPNVSEANGPPKGTLEPCCDFLLVVKWGQQSNFLRHFANFGKTTRHEQWTCGAQQRRGYTQSPSSELAPKSVGHAGRNLGAFCRLDVRT